MTETYRQIRKAGFTLIEVIIALSLLAVTVFIFATLFTNQHKAGKSVKTVSIRDVGYFQVGRLASDPSALAYSYAASPGGCALDPDTNCCLKACMAGVSSFCDNPNNAWDNETSSACQSWKEVAGVRTLKWYPFTLYNPATATPVAGPNVDIGASPHEAGNPIRYNRKGEMCPDANAPDSQCPIEAKAFFHPVCSQLNNICNKPASIIVKYEFSWTTNTSVARQGEIAALKSLSNEVEIPSKLIVGSSNGVGFWDPPTGTGTSSGTATVTTTNTVTVTTTITATVTTTNTGSGTGTGGCFLAGTKIWGERGQTPIEELKIGDRVWAMNAQGEMVLSRVSKTFQHERASYYQMKLSDGTFLRVTAEHPFASRLAKRWIETVHLKAGDYVTVLQGDPDESISGERQVRQVAISGLDRVEQATRVFNIEVEGTHVYFAEGVLVHNKTSSGVGSSTL